ncbi:sulfurtransferase [Paenibacillus tepidiphilus]|uniref:sulfurtransferase n=1 Tax=Paenibacillus tepidiphilus TaxID=2608683 RepID=UPI00123BE976|nr:rhodanese-like domain-containing protein [Paenibacillus tepidiphilus]
MSSLPLTVNTDWLAERLEDPALRLLDATTYLQFPEDGGYYKVNSGRETYKQGHIPGAVFADLHLELADPDGAYPFTVPGHDYFAEKIGQLGVGGDDVYVVVYDQGVGPSAWASRLWWQLRLEGFDRVAVLEGGLKKWQDEGRPVSDEPGAYPPAIFTGQRRSELLATKEDVKLAIGDESTLLVNSLSPADHNGETKTYARSGHIPGSVNIFIAKHTKPGSSTLVDEEALRSNLAEHGALDEDKKVITYCGGGIAATWNALVFKKLGKDVAVYDGSLSEWAADPTLPIENPSAAKA